MSLYALFKYVTSGPAKLKSKPSTWSVDMVAKYKWEAHNNLGDTLTKDQAKKMYISLVTKLDPAFKARISSDINTATDGARHLIDLTTSLNASRLDLLTCQKPEVIRAVKVIEEKFLNQEYEEAWNLCVNANRDFPSTSNILWRLARAYKQMALMKEEEIERKRELITEGLRVAREALEVNESNPNAHRWVV